MVKPDRNKLKKNQQQQGESVSGPFYKTHKNLFSLLIIILLTLIVYSGSIQNDLTNWDDDRHITNNADIKEISARNIKSMFSTSYVGMYHPLTTLSFAVEYSLFGLSPAVFHGTNLLLHLLNVIMVYLLVLSLFSDFRAALFTAFIMALHPMHAESVCWVTERKDLLYTLFFTGALVSYVMYLKNNKGLFCLIMTFILFVLSLLSKSAAVVLPVVMLLTDYLFRRKFTGRSLSEKVPFFIMSVLFGLISVYTQNVQHISYDSSQTYHLFDKIFLVSYNLLYYVISFFVPFGLSVFHAFPIKVNGFLPVEYYFSFLIIIILFFLIYKYFLKKRDVVFGLSFFLIGMILILQIVQIGYASVGERYTYLPYAGLAIAVFFIARDLIPKKFIQSGYTKTILIIYGLLLGALTFSRNGVWKDSISLWSDAISHDSTSNFAWYNRASTYFSMKDYKNALADYNMALQNQSGDADSYNNRGLCKFMMKDYRGALEDYDKAIHYQNKSAEFYTNRANVKDKLEDYKGAIEDYTNAIKMTPLNADLYYYRGLSKSASGNKTGALEDYQSALKINPVNAEIYKSTGNLQIELNDMKGAINAFTKAIEINPSDEVSYNNRGNLKDALRDRHGAIDDYSAAIKIKPGFEEAYLNRAVTKMSAGDFNGAIADYSNALRINPENETALNNRGAIFVNLKKYQDAVDDFNAAIKINHNFAEAYKNRGIAEYYLDHKTNACQDIQQAVTLGSVHAKTLVKMVCR